MIPIIESQFKTAGRSPLLGLLVLRLLLGVPLCLPSSSPICLLLLTII